MVEVGRAGHGHWRLKRTRPDISATCTTVQVTRPGQPSSSDLLPRRSGPREKARYEQASHQPDVATGTLLATSCLRGSGGAGPGPRSSLSLPLSLAQQLVWREVPMPVKACTTALEPML